MKDDKSQDPLQKSEPEEQKPKDPRAEQRKKTLLAAGIMLVPFLLIMALLYGRLKKPEPINVDGINVEVPDGRGETIEQSKEKAQEKVRREESRAERVGTLGDDFFSLLPTENTPEQESSPEQTGDRRSRNARESIRRSEQAHRDMTRQMAALGAAASEDPEISELRRQVEELTARLQDKESRSTDPLEMLEQSYALAAKYFGTEEPVPASEPEKSRSRKPSISLAQPQQRSVSGLVRPIPDTVLIEMLAQERNYDFVTPVGQRDALTRNAIRACVDSDQTITTGKPLKLRLQESIVVDGTVIAAGTILTAQTRLNGHRLEVSVSSIEYAGSILPVELTAYDTDGQKGLHVPDSKERTALKEAMANVGSGLGSSLSIARSAGEQVAMDLSRGVMTGGSRYIATQLREVKLTLKANYQILLLAKP